MKVEEVEIPGDVAAIISDFSDAILKRFPDARDVLKPISVIPRVMLGHTTLEGQTVYFELDRESRGTRELMGLLGPVFDSLHSGKLLIIDELDSSLHPLLAIKIVELFQIADTNPGGGQLLFTTHDTNLLNRGILRRDEVWFTEKDKNGATHLYPLTDIQTRNTDNLQKGYMQGRFGAIPYLGDIRRLFSARGGGELTSDGGS